MSKTPKLRFKEFSGDWEENELGNIVEISKGKYNPLKSEENYKCIELENLSQETGQLLGYFNSKEQQSIKNKFNKGQVLFGKLRPYLKKYWLADFEGVCSSEIWVLNGKSVSNNFIYRIIQTDKFNFISNISSGSKMPRADWNYMSEFPFFTPSIEEQEKIASLFSLIDDKISLQGEKLKMLKDYKKGMMQKIFSRELRFKYDDGRDYPEWEVTTIENIANLEKGFTPDTKNEKNWIGDIPWLSIADMKQGKYISDVSKHISCEALGNKKLVAKGTLIMSFKLTLGRLAIVNRDIMTNEAICHFYWKYKNINTEYMYYYLSTVNIESFGCRAAKGITLNNDSLNSIVVKIPSISEQNKIANALIMLDGKIEREQEKLDSLNEYKKGLLQQMFV